MVDVLPSLTGNSKLKSILSDSIYSHKVNHAYIIEGPEGSGKHTLAGDIIKGLCCRKQSNEFPCGICPNCRKINADMFADVFYLNRGDKAKIQIEAVRDMLETLNFSPNEDSDYKFYVIEEAEKLTLQSQNALLLSLEEPPEYVVFLLLTTDAQTLLETIRSRSVVLRMELFSAEFTYNHLKSIPDFSKYPDDKLKNAAAVSAGALGAAKTILNGSDKSSVFAGEAQKFVSLLCSRSRTEMLIFVNSLKHDRNEYGIIFKFMQSALRDLIAYKNGGTYFSFYTDKDTMSTICSRITLSKLLNIYELTVNAENDIVTSNSNVNLTLSHFAASAM